MRPVEIAWDPRAADGLVWFSEFGGRGPWNRTTWTVEFVATLDAERINPRFIGYPLKETLLRIWHVIPPEQTPRSLLSEFARLAAESKFARVELVAVYGPMDDAAREIVRLLNQSAADAESMARLREAVS
jgi:hypothetical protein